MINKLKNAKLNKRKAKSVNLYLGHMLISIVAIIETIILLCFSTFSWIESSSSLEIKNAGDGTGADSSLHVSKTLNYKINNDATGTVDLSSFFNDSDSFKYAKTSTADGMNFWFPKTNKTSQFSGNRKGDTTDFNTSYRNLDFVFSNGNDAAIYYGFKEDSFFSFPDIENDDLASAASQAFKFSIQKDNGSCMIYGMSSTPYAAISGATSSSTKTISAKTVKVTADDHPTTAFVVSSHAVSKIKIRIWFDIKSLSTDYQSDEYINQILTSKVNINLKFEPISGEPEENKSRIWLDDTFAAMFSTSSTIKLTGIKNADNGTSYGSDITLTYNTTDKKFESAGNVLDLDRYTLVDAYFYQGDTKKSYCLANPSPELGDLVTFTTLSYVKTTDSKLYALGTWGDYKTIYFDNPTVHEDYCNYYSNSSFNDQTGVANKIVSTNSNVYVNLNEGEDSYIETAKLTYDNNLEMWTAKVPSSFVSSNMKFYYFYNSQYFDISGDCRVIQAPNPKLNAENKYVCQTLGFCDDTNSEGFATWSTTSKITLSTELMDMIVSSSDRYKVGVNVNGVDYFYYLRPDSNTLRSFAYIPSEVNNLKFSRMEDETNATIIDTGSRGSKTTCYLINDNNPSTGLTSSWNPVVLVDGTAEHLIYEIKEDPSNGSSLEYTVDGSNWSKLKQIDDYRWYASCDTDVENVTVRWLAYSSTNTVWSQEVSLGENIYVTFTE